MKSALNRIKEEDCALPMVFGYNMFSENFPMDYSRPITQQISFGVRAYNVFDKQIIFDPNQLDEILYNEGAHQCNPVFKKGANMAVSDIPFFLLHYKYIDQDYLIDKHRLYASRMSEFNHKYGFGAEYLHGEEHIKKCFELIKNSNKLVNVLNIPGNT